MSLFFCQNVFFNLNIASIIHIVIFCKIISWGWLKKVDKKLNINKLKEIKKLAVMKLKMTVSKGKEELVK